MRDLERWKRHLGIVWKVFIHSQFGQLVLAKSRYNDHNLTPI